MQSQGNFLQSLYLPWRCTDLVPARNPVQICGFARPACLQ